MKETIAKLPRHGFQLDAEGDDCAEYIKQVHGRAIKYTYQLRDLRRIARILEGKLDLAGIAESRRRGLTAIAQSAGPGRQRKTAKWNSQVCGSLVQLQRYASGWRLMSATRVVLYAGHKEKLVITVSRSEIEAVKKRAVACFEVAAEHDQHEGIVCETERRTVEFSGHSRLAKQLYSEADMITAIGVA